MNLFTSLKQKTRNQIIKQILNASTHVSDENIVKLAKLAMKLTPRKKGASITLVQQFEDRLPILTVTKKALNNLSPKCREKAINNLFIHTIVETNDKRKEYAKEHGYQPPFLLVISPTMRCNLDCVGCYAGEYTKKDDLPFEEVDRILTEAKQMGISFITISGGEPFIYEHLFDIFKKHNDMFFQIYTNGTLITKEVAQKLAEVGNAMPAISVEGFETETDKRRGSGVYSKVLSAMDNLKEAGVLFGFSATPTSINADVLASDEFIDFYINKGCYFGWFFQYIPIGKKPNIGLMSSPEQRNKLRKKIIEWRKTKPIFIGDFWNDGPYVCGCMAGATKYLHITCKGDVEPCVFTHFAVDNIKGKKLEEVINSDFFKAIRKRQRKIDNLLTPCCIIDHPDILREAFEETGAYPTHEGAETIVLDPEIKAHLDQYSKRMEELTREDWESDFYAKYRGLKDEKYARREKEEENR